MNAKPTQARETLDALHEVSRMLNTGLDKETLGLLVALCEAGVNPEALAHGIRELHRTGEGGSGTTKQ
ncbi:uncharacterized protein ACA1_045050 [Acanthamoeba castellanii str. Neff]|uniref:Mitotic-spindle organizing protein 1 n=1 Tax=Acanthamoeba castellanii (strain ATCC 30010 / Neff) TaxID=1257118 RepID=L8GZR1_ACACF|nr:uncharacterized protein ACA1_045050 [Acanthamoeba castellanii str. Neff]ELR18485.1 hypothetical protein ACA1_045050 [Acanthamoeba castellanii str. Neff]